MLFIFSTPELIRNLWQLKTAVFLHWCIIRAVPLLETWFWSHFVVLLKSYLDVPHTPHPTSPPQVCWRSKFDVSSVTKSDQNHTNFCYDFSPTLLRYLSLTWFISLNNIMSHCQKMCKCLMNFKSIGAFSLWKWRQGFKSFAFKTVFASVGKNRESVTISF